MDSLIIKETSASQIVYDSTKVPPLAHVPPKGWTTWVTYSKEVDEAKVKSLADFIANEGFKDFGLDYVMIDAGWQYMLEEGETIVDNGDGSFSSSNGVLLRNTDGVIIPDSEKFPNGMTAITNYIHSLGLKAGIYSSPGILDCVRSMGSYGHEEIDANTFASWGFDMLKYDNCSLNSGMYEAYSKMAKFLQATGKDFLYYLCLFNIEKPYKWGAKVGHYWRLTLDPSGYFINPSQVTKHVDAMGAYEKALQYINYNQPNGWNDCTDIIVTSTRMNDIEVQTQFALFCMLNLPIILEGNPTLLTQGRKDIIKNKYLYSIHSDVAEMVKRVFHSPSFDVLVKPLKQGVAILLFNRGDSSYTYSGNLLEYLSDYCGCGYNVYDALDNCNNLGALGTSLTTLLASHQCAVYIVK